MLARSLPVAVPTRCRVFDLEGDPGGELEGAWTASAEDRIDAATRLTKGRLLNRSGCLFGKLNRQRIQPAAVAVEVGNVEEVERFADQRNLHLFANRNQARQADILRKERISVGVVRRQIDERVRLVLRRSGGAQALAINNQSASRKLRRGRVVWNRFRPLDDIGVVPVYAIPDVARALASSERVPGDSRQQEPGVAISVNIQPQSWIQRLPAPHIRNQPDLPAIGQSAQQLVVAFVFGHFVKAAEGEAADLSQDRQVMDKTNF